MTLALVFADFAAQPRIEAPLLGDARHRLALLALPLGVVPHVAGGEREARVRLAVASAASALLVTALHAPGARQRPDSYAGNSVYRHTSLLKYENARL